MKRTKLRPRISKPTFPVIRIVPLKQLVLHERTDSRRVLRLQRRFTQSSVMKNPIIVMPDHARRRYIVLDGANRTSVLRRSRFPHALVQIVEPDTVRLSVWNHLVFFPGLLQRIVTLAKRSGLHTVRIPPGRSGRTRRLARLQAMTRSQATAIRLPVQALHLALFLRQVVGVYAGRHRYYRVDEETFGQASRLYPDGQTLLVFPTFTVSDIRRLGAAGTVLPAGITRTVLANRALSVNFPLSILRGPKTAAEKNAVLRRRLQQGIAAGRVRYYDEPVTICND